MTGHERRWPVPLWCASACVFVGQALSPANRLAIEQPHGGRDYSIEAVRNRRRETGTERKLRARDREHSGFGRAPIQSARAGQQRFRSRVVSEAHANGRRLDPALADLTGDRALAGVDENDTRGAADRLHQLRSELMHRTNLDIGALDYLSQS